MYVFVPGRLAGSAVHFKMLKTHTIKKIFLPIHCMFPINDETSGMLPLSTINRR